MLPPKKICFLYPLWQKGNEKATTFPLQGRNQTQHGCFLHKKTEKVKKRRCDEICGTGFFSLHLLPHCAIMETTSILI